MLKSDLAATEIMTYTAWMFVLIGCWFAVQRNQYLKQPLPKSALWVAATPAFLALAGASLLSNTEGYASLVMVPDGFFVLLLLLPMGLSYRKSSPVLEAVGHDEWSYTALTKVPLHAIFTFFIFLLTSDVFVTMVFAALFLPLYYAPSALLGWPWACLLYTSPSPRDS